MYLTRIRRVLAARLKPAVANISQPAPKNVTQRVRARANATTRRLAFISAEADFSVNVYLRRRSQMDEAVSRLLPAA